MGSRALALLRLPGALHEEAPVYRAVPAPIPCRPRSRRSSGAGLNAARAASFFLANCGMVRPGGRGPDVWSLGCPLTRPSMTSRTSGGGSRGPAGLAPQLHLRPLAEASAGGVDPGNDPGALGARVGADLGRAPLRRRASAGARAPGASRNGVRFRRRRPQPGEPHGTPESLRLDPAHTFDRFVIGPGNRLAHGAALAVAELPGEAYNPLFLHGPPGLGKTHLLGAIVDYMRRNHPALVVHYTTAERFTSEFVGALRRDGPSCSRRATARSTRC